MEEESQLAELYQDPSVAIEAARQTALAMGANDSENSEFDAIQARLKAGEMSPEAAVSQARGIIERKHDYH